MKYETFEDDHWIAEYKKSPPKPPPMREYNGYTLVNEYKTVDWYTDKGELFPEDKLTTRLPKTWFGRLFMSFDQMKLERSLMINREMCKEWPHK